MMYATVPTSTLILPLTKVKIKNKMHTPGSIASLLGATVRSRVERLRMVTQMHHIITHALQAYLGPLKMASSRARKRFRKQTFATRA